MDIEKVLLTALEKDPCDESTWLVLADWLEEQGQQHRTEFLRLQRSLRGLPEGEQREALESRLTELLVGGVRPWTPVITNSIGMQLALIPPGQFWLGSPENEVGRYNDESPRRLITLSQPFYLGIYPVTQQQYERCIGHNPSAFAPLGRLGDVVSGRDTSMHPVECVNWYEAVAFCQMLSDLPREQAAGRVYRLPTECEWEYACRGGVALSCPFPYGKTISTRLANYRDTARNRSSSRRRHTTPVGSYPPNGFGLYDMVGNVWEWCQDWYASTAYMFNPDTDPPGPKEGERRNARGGTYNLETRRVRSADRSSFEPDQRDSDLGFRVLCEWRPR
jgi:uncharacterized protein (TIGR02996 family)